MICPNCGADREYKNLCTSPRIAVNVIWRRKECLICGKRFTTYEIPSSPKLIKMIKVLDRKRLPSQNLEI